MTIRSLFLVAVSGLLIAITVITSVFVAVEIKSTITADVQEQKNALRDEVYSILSVTDSLMAKRVKSSLDFLVERGDRIGIKLNLNSGAGRAIKRGETFFGQVKILGNPYLTAYSPMRNELGVMAQGFDNLLNRLQATIAETKQSSNSWLEASDKLGQIASASAVAEQAGQTNLLALNAAIEAASTAVALRWYLMR